MADDVHEVNFIGSNLNGQDLRVTCTTHEKLLAKEFVVRQTRGSRWFYVTSIAPLVAVFLSINHAMACAGLLVVILWIKVNFIDVIEESILVVRSLGLQVKVKYASGRETSQFIELSTISDVIINEGISMHQVLFYLALLIEGRTQDAKQKRLLPLLMFTVPRLGTIKPIYHGICQVLFAEKTNGSTKPKTS